jgi:5'-3' exonuclease
MFDLYLNNEKPIVLIDCSYYIFHRYHATTRWYQFKGIDIEPQNLSQEFINSFTDHFHKDILKITKRFKTVKSNIYMCVDCLRCDIWRNEFCNNYKGKRVHNEKFNRDIFDIFKTKINTYITQIEFNNLEADDVVAIVHKQIRQKQPMKKIIIITNDNDYLQLGDDYTEILNLIKFKNICFRNTENNIREHMIVKCLTGDKSDNISKIPKITKKRATELSQDEDELMKWLKDTNNLEQFNNNMKLISFDKIPEHLIKQSLLSLNIVE